MGTYYDVETGLYYLQSRYYNPEWGRFISADGYISTGQGILGYNMFAYCGNNPPNKVDYSGNKPGDLFDTMDLAAIDAAEYLGALSWEDGWEYATAIYSVKSPVKTYSKVTKTYRFLWWTRTTTFVKVKVTVKMQYTYKAVRTDEKNNNVTIPKAPLFKKRLAGLHTHPMGSGGGVTRFSERDIEWSREHGIPLYVHGPNGELRKYDPATGKDVLVFSDLPHSPYSPWE